MTSFAKAAGLAGILVAAFAKDRSLMASDPGRRIGK